MKKVNERMIIPVSLCNMTVRNKEWKLLQMYVYLKSICRGKIRVDDLVFTDVANELGYKTVVPINNMLAELKRINWIGYNERSSYLHIRGFEKV